MPEDFRSPLVCCIANHRNQEGQDPRKGCMGALLLRSVSSKHTWVGPILLPCCKDRLSAFESQGKMYAPEIRLTVRRNWKTTSSSFSSFVPVASLEKACHMNGGGLLSPQMFWRPRLRNASRCAQGIPLPLWTYRLSRSIGLWGQYCWCQQVPIIRWPEK